LRVLRFLLSVLENWAGEAYNVFVSLEGEVFRMKKTVSVLVALLLCVLLMGEAFAIVLPEHLVETGEVGTGTVIEEEPAGPLEVSGYLGKTEEEFRAYAEEMGKELPVGMYDGVNGEIITEFAFRDGDDVDFAFFGYELDGRYDSGLREKMEADGWTCVRKDFEGGLKWYEFEKTVGDQVHCFKLDGCDGNVTYLELSIKK